jgi:Lrp/AsnC family leucine-responsive transcriptional regulator
MEIKLDEVDIQLLAALQADADRTNVQLARLTGLSPAATLHRVRALKDSGVIRIIRAHVDPQTAGFALHVYVTAALTRHDPRSERAFEDQVRALPQVLWADSIAGETDYLLSIVARDVSELQQVLSRLTARGARIVTFLRLGDVKPVSPLPLGPTPPPVTPRSPRSRELRKLRHPARCAPRPPASAFAGIGANHN